VSLAATVAENQNFLQEKIFHLEENLSVQSQNPIDAVAVTR